MLTLIASNESEPLPKFQGYRYFSPKVTLELFPFTGTLTNFTENYLGSEKFLLSSGTVKRLLLMGNQGTQ